jgi:hypothetical protein
MVSGSSAFPTGQQTSQVKNRNSLVSGNVGSPKPSRKEVGWAGKEGWLLPPSPQEGLRGPLGAHRRWGGAESTESGASTGDTLSSLAPQPQFLHLTQEPLQASFLSQTVPLLDWLEVQLTIPGAGSRQTPNQTKGPCFPPAL